MKNVISWFEIPTTQLGQAQAFYESVLGLAMRREAMGPSQGGCVALPRQALPPGRGFFSHIHGLDGNRVGLHALA